MYHMLHINFKLAIRATKIRSLADFQIFVISWSYVWWQLGCVSTQESIFWTACPQVHDDLPQFENFAFSHKLPQPPLYPPSYRLHPISQPKTYWDFSTCACTMKMRRNNEQPPNRKDGLRLTCIKWSLSHCPGYEDQQGREISITILWGNRYGFFLWWLF